MSLDETTLTQSRTQARWYKIGSSDLASRQYQPVVGHLDRAVFAIDGSADNPVIALADGEGVNWRPAASNLPFRYRVAGMVLTETAWVSGGKTQQGALVSEVYATIDGSTWDKRTSAAPWSPRAGHSMAAFNDRLWVMAGWDERGGYFPDVWTSLDGQAWTQVSGDALPYTMNAAAIAFAGKLWLIGGSKSDSQVRSTTDGANWTLHAAPWDSARQAMRVHVIGDTLYALGGTEGGRSAFTDVYATRDGLSWQAVSDGGPWRSGNGFGSFVADGAITVFGGSDASGATSADVYQFTPG